MRGDDLSPSPFRPVRLRTRRRLTAFSRGIRAPATSSRIAGRGYDARAVLGLIAAQGGRGHIPTQRDRKAQRPVDPVLYRTRDLIKRFFNTLKHVRKVATRYEKPGQSYRAGVLIALSRLWMRRYETAS